MPAKITKLYSKILDQKFLDEMDLLLRLAEEKPDKAFDSGTSVAVARLVPGVSLEDWQAFANGHNLTGWLALPIGPEAASAGRSRHFGLPLFDRRHFEHMADAEISSAVSGSFTAALAVLELDCPDSSKVDETAWFVYDHLRSNELLERLSPNRVAVLLLGLGLHSARMRLETMKTGLLSMEKNRGPLSLRAALSCCSGRIRVSARELIDLVEFGLSDDNAKSSDWIVVCDLPGEMEAVKAAMVHSDEKRFLFVRGR